MTVTLSQLFMESKGAPVEWEGCTVQMMCEFDDVHSGEQLDIEFLSWTSSRREALRVEAKGGTLVVNSMSIKKTVLWVDTAPRVVTLLPQVQRGRETMTLLVWNAWQNQWGTLDAWLSHAGMVIETAPDGSTLLRCSDGVGATEFSDLVVRLRRKSSVM